MTTEATLFWSWLLSVAISTLVGMSRGQAISGLVWGFFFGPVGIVIVLFLPNKVAERKAAEAKARDDERVGLMKLTLAAQEEQLRLLRKLSGTPEPAPVVPPELKKPEPKRAEALDDFIPESLMGLRARPKASTGDSEIEDILHAFMPEEGSPKSGSL